MCVALKNKQQSWLPQSWKVWISSQCIIQTHQNMFCFKIFPQSCLLLVYIFNMCIRLIFSNWCSVLHMHRRRRIWGELINFLRCSMCSCLLRISLRGICVEKNCLLFYSVLSTTWPTRSGMTTKSKLCFLAFRKQLPSWRFVGMLHLEGDPRGRLLGFSSAFPLHPIPGRALRTDPSSSKHRNWPVQ